MTEAEIAERFVPDLPRLVWWMIKRGRLPGGHRMIDEMLSIAQAGLLNAIRLYDASRGVKFTTYMICAVKNECQRQLTCYEPSRGCVMQKRRAKVVSLSTPLRSKKGDGFTLLDAIARNRMANEPSAPAMSDRSKESFWRQAVRSLPKRHGEVMLSRFRDGLTLEETAEKFGVTRERIRQIQVRCLRKLQADKTIARRLGL